MGLGGGQIGGLAVLGVAVEGVGVDEGGVEGEVVVAGDEEFAVRWGMDGLDMVH